MRNDLRLPGTLTGCPRCGRPLNAAASALRKDQLRWRERLTRVSPVRDTLLFLPALGAFVAAAFFAFTFPEPAGAGWLAIRAALTLGALLGLGGSWVLWALLVLGIGWLLAPRRSLDPLRPVPFPSAVAATRAERRWRAPFEWFERHQHVVTPLAFAAAGGLDVAISWLMHGPASSGLSNSIRSTFINSTILELSIFVAAGGLIGLLSSSFVGSGVSALRFVLERLDLVLAHASRELALHEAVERGLGRATRPSRERAAGTAAPLDGGSLIAPLSGEPCLAFRLVGRVGALRIDDSDAAPFLVREDSAGVAVRAAAWVVALEAPLAAKVVLDEAQRERLAAFLHQRGLPSGDIDDVHGAAGRELDPDAQGYRGAEMRRVLSDADGEPVLIRTG